MLQVLITFKVIRAEREAQSIGATLWYTLREVFPLPIAGSPDLLLAQSRTVQLLMQILEKIRAQ